MDKPSPSPRIPGLRDSVPGAAYKKGDVIGGKYEVHGVLGQGGFGIVYLVYSRDTKSVYALKTFRDECLADALTRERFRREASVWVDLERHPYLVRAYFVDEVAGRLFIGLEFIAPDENGLNSLDGHLRRGRPDLAQSLRWAIQFCHGMEHACSKGVRCHRDIKPANIMVDRSKLVKVTDFGLAGALSESKAGSGIRVNVQQGVVGLSVQTVEGTGFGTPTHMAPEQFTNAASCDERSDVYSFGVVLYQMACEGRLPFLAVPPKDDSDAESIRFWREMHRLHVHASVPKLESPLSPIIQRCLHKEPGRRYHRFQDLRGDLEALLVCQTGECVRLPVQVQSTLEAWEWNNKGVSLHSVGRYDEAIRCFDKAIKLDPRNAGIWCNKGRSVDMLGVSWEERIHCYAEALRIGPQDAATWNNVGTHHERFGEHGDAIRCFDKSLELDPQNVAAWCNKGISLGGVGRHAEAILCFDKTLEIDPQNARAWFEKGKSFNRLTQYEEAVHCYDKSLEVDPRSADAWYGKGDGLSRLGRHEEAIWCCDRALVLFPRNAWCWYVRGNSLLSLRRYQEALRSYDQALRLDRQSPALFGKVDVLERLGRPEEAARYKARTLEPFSGRALIDSLRAQEKPDAAKPDGLPLPSPYVARAVDEGGSDNKDAKRRADESGRE